MDYTQKKFAPATSYPCYIDRLRQGLPPLDDDPSPDPEQLRISSQLSPAPAPVPATEAPEPVPLSAIATAFPDPCRPFWWFSSTRVSESIHAGCPIRADAGSRLPLEADYWCHEGDVEWVKAIREGRPKPAPRKGDRKRRKPFWSARYQVQA